MNEESTSTRKEFLQTAGVAAGVAAVATFGFSRPARAQESDGGGVISQLARFGLQEGKEEDAKALLQTLIKGVEENEPGVLTYIAHFSEKTGDVVFFEVYANAEALAAHGQTPHMNEMRTKFASVFKPPLDIEKLDRIAAVNR